MKETETKEHKKQLLKALEANEAIQCGKCGYGWIPIKKEPKSCPRCKARLDWK